MQRTALAVVVLLVALGAAFAATRARRLGTRVDSFAVDVGVDAAAVPQIGDDAPASPWRCAVIPPVRGDHAALGAAMDAVRAEGGVDFVVLRGDVLLEGDDAEGRLLAAAFRDRGVPVLAVPGPVDLAHLGTFQRWVSPVRWTFTTKGTQFTSDDFAAGGAPRAIEIRSGPRPHDAETIDAPSAPFAAAWRRIALSVLDPLVRGRAGYAVFLGVCVLVATMALTALRPARRAAPRGTAVRTAS